METEVSQLKALLRALALYAEARGRLLQIETQEAGGKFSSILVLASVLAGFLLCGWLMAVPAVIWMISQSQGWPWHLVALGFAGLHLFFAFIALLMLLSRLRRLKVFEETFNQFHKDREWLSGTPPSK